MSGQIVCSQHGGCSPSACFDLHAAEPVGAPDARCGPCKIREHEWCEAAEMAGRLNRCCCGITTRGLGERADPDAST